MIALWMMYSTMIALVFGCAAVLVERALLIRGGETRWVWIGSMVGSLLFVSAMYTRPRPLIQPPRQAIFFDGATGEQVWPRPPRGRSAVLHHVRQAAPVANVPLELLWLVSVIGIVAYVCVSRINLARRRSQWLNARITGVDVYVSHDVGPALVGLRNPAIVVPEWLLYCDEEQQRLVIAHELAHADARDPLLLAGGFLLAAVMPWNIALWWQLRRLRCAVEIDCDARVMRRHHDVRGYGNLLLSVAARVANAPGSNLQATFSEPASLLERRIRVLGMKLPRFAPAFAIAQITVATALVLAACFAPVPDTTDPTGPLARGGRLPALRGYVDAGLRTNAVSPELLNAAQISRVIEVEAVRLRRIAQCGTALVELRVDVTGNVDVVRLRESTNKAHQEAVVRIARELRYRPARVDGRVVSAWMILAINFMTEPPKGNDVFADPAMIDLTAPSYLFVIAPQLVNADELERAVELEYPARERASGIGGDVLIWQHVDQDGRVTESSFRQTSGTPELDAAAQRVAERMRYTPSGQSGADFSCDRSSAGPPVCVRGPQKMLAVPVWVTAQIAFNPVRSVVSVVPEHPEPSDPRPAAVR